MFPEMKDQYIIKEEPLLSSQHQRRLEQHKCYLLIITWQAAAAHEIINDKELQITLGLNSGKPLFLYLIISCYNTRGSCQRNPFHL